MTINHRILFIFLFIAVIGIRIFHIQADAPADLSFSAGIFTDEMHNIHQVRNKILFGSWNLDNYTSTAYSPIFAGLQYILLSVLGVGLWQIKITPVLLSIFSIILTYKSLHEYFGKPFGLVGALLLGFNYTFIMYNRLGLYENLVVFFMCLSFFFWQRSVKTKREGYFFLTGFSSGCVFMAKTLYLHFVIAAIIALVIYFLKKRNRETARQMILGFAGLATAGLVWYFILYLPFKTGLTVLGSSWMKRNIGPENLLEALQINPILTLFLRFRFFPVTMVCAILFFAVSIYQGIKNPSKIDDVIVFILLWFIGGMLFLGLLSYNPTRYYLPILPSVVLMAAIGICFYAYRIDAVQIDFHDRRSYFVLFAMGSILFFYFLIPYFLKYEPRMAKQLMMDGLPKTVQLAASALFGVVVAAIVWGATRLKNSNPKGFKIFFILMAFLFFFFFSLPFYNLFESRIEVHLKSDINGVMQFYWAENDHVYDEARSIGIRIQKDKNFYKAVIPKLDSIRYFRIDPIQEPGEVTIGSIRFVQPGHSPVDLKTKEQFQRIIPINQISDMIFSDDGLKVVSEGHDPHFEIELNSVFKTRLFCFYLLKAMLPAVLITVILIFLYSVLKKRYRKDHETHQIRRLGAWACVILIIGINLFYYLKWARHPDYSILNTSEEIGRILPPDSLIAGVGVMTVTINNHLRHLLAPTWFEDPKKIFQTYPITHLFISPYAGYLSWYKIHYPKVMEYAKEMASYRIVGRNFYLFELNIPEDKREDAFRYR